MSSRSNEAPLPIGFVHGFRGRDGELTVRVASGRAERWKDLKRVLVGSVDGADPAGPREAIVASCRAYRDRLVLKLEGVDSAAAAAELKGRVMFAPAEEVPALPEGEYWVDRLRGMDVVDSRGTSLGRVDDVLETGGTDLLSVTDAAGRQILIPLAREIVLAVNEDARSIVVALPEGLAEVNREGGRA